MVLKFCLRSHIILYSLTAAKFSSDTLQLEFPFVDEEYLERFETEEREDRKDGLPDDDGDDLGSSGEL